jgi:hypothetical protein
MSHWQDEHYVARRMSDAYPSRATRRQLDTIAAMVAERGLEFPVVRGMIKEITGTNGHADILTIHQADGLIHRLKQIAKVTA